MEPICAKCARGRSYSARKRAGLEQAYRDADPITFEWHAIYAEQDGKCAYCAQRRELFTYRWPAPNPADLVCVNCYRGRLRTAHKPKKWLRR